MRMQLLGIALLATAPLGAQAFEGVITMRIRNAETTTEMRAYVTEARQAMVMQMPASAGPMAGAEVRMVINPGTGKITMLVPAGSARAMPPGVKGMKMQVDMQETVDAVTSENPVPKKLGTSQTVAGMKCDDYEVSTSDGVMRLCMTEALGNYSFPEMTGRGGRPGGVPEWARAFGDKPAFPLKVWNLEGTVSMEVTNVQRGNVPADMLNESPDGYMDPRAMMGGINRGNN